MAVHPSERATARAVATGPPALVGARRLTWRSERSWLLLGLLILAVFPLKAGSYQQNLMSQYLLFAILGLSLDLVWSYTGILSLCQGLFFGAGAYAMALISKNWHFDARSWAGLLVALLLASAIAAAFGWFAFYSRMAAAYFGIASLALALIAEEVPIQIQRIGGFNGIASIPSFVLALPGFSFELDDRATYYLALVALVLAYLCSRRLVKSSLGRILVAIKDNEERTQFLGYDTARYKVLVFSIAGGLAGIAGALYAPTSGFVAPSLTGFVLSTEVAIWISVGGRGTLAGAILGTLLINEVGSFLNATLVAYWTAILGLLFVVVVIGFPQGIYPFVMRRLAGKRLSTEDVAVTEPAPAASADTAEGAILEVRGLRKRFRELKTINGLDLTIGQRELRCLVGPNGAGKTTLINLITGRLASDGGEVRFQGRSVTGLAPHRLALRGIGRKFQIPNVINSLTVRDNLALASRRRQRWWSFLFGGATAELDADVWAVACRSGLDARLGERAADLSHGEKQSLELCMVLAGRPRVLLLDEPTAGLTAAETRTVAQLIRTLWETHHVAIVVIEHDMSFVQEVGAPVTVIHRGAVLASGSLDEIRADPAVRDVYLGSAH